MTYKQYLTKPENVIIDKDHDFMIGAPYATITQRTTGTNKNVIRLYRDSTQTVTLQIRTHKGIGQFSKGKERDMIASVALTVEDLRVLLAKAESYWS